MERYSFNIAWSEKDGEFLATCPAFPGLSAFGETEEEALAEGKIALELFIESFTERNLPLPREVRKEEYSGQFRLRLSPVLHRQAAGLAAAEGQSLNTFISLAVQAKVSEQHAEKVYTSHLVNQVATRIGNEIAQYLFFQPEETGFREYAAVRGPIQHDWSNQISTSKFKAPFFMPAHRIGQLTLSDVEKETL